MKPLILDSTMTNMGGVFYPTGHVFALFPDEDCVRQAATALQAAGHQGDTAYASPEVIMQEIVHTLGTADAPLPFWVMIAALARPETPRTAATAVVRRAGMNFILNP